MNILTGSIGHCILIHTYILLTFKTGWITFLLFWVFSSQDFPSKFYSCFNLYWTIWSNFTNLCLDSMCNLSSNCTRTTLSYVHSETSGTGKSVSEALTLESVNPQYDERLFNEFHEKYKFTTCCVQILFWMSKQKQKNNFCAQHVLPMFWACSFHVLNW